MARLTEAEVARFHRDGYLLVENAVTPETLAALRADLAQWVGESRAHPVNWGETVDGRERFDLEAGHSAAEARLRRVNNPAEISPAYERAIRDGPIPDLVAALIGPDVAFHHCKINLKLPGTATRVGYHQDFSYTPHTNDDLVTVLLMLDDMTLANGCLKVVPGSHREGQVSLWHDGVFTGETAPEATDDYERRAVAVTGRAGDACLMHTSLMHGSAPNDSAHPRGLFIAVYAAADAVPLAPSPLPNRFAGAIVRGRARHTARLTVAEVELPPPYRNTSFFEVQGQASAHAKG